MPIYFHSCHVWYLLSTLEHDPLVYVRARLLYLCQHIIVQDAIRTRYIRTKKFMLIVEALSIYVLHLELIFQHEAIFHPNYLDEISPFSVMALLICTTGATQSNTKVGCYLLSTIIIWSLLLSLSWCYTARIPYL